MHSRLGGKVKYFVVLNASYKSIYKFLSYFPSTQRKLFLPWQDTKMHMQCDNLSLIGPSKGKMHFLSVSQYLQFFKFIVLFEENNGELVCRGVYNTPLLFTVIYQNYMYGLK